jgi:hypothetical protein
MSSTDKQDPKINSTCELKRSSVNESSQLYIDSNDGQGDKMVDRDRSLYAYVKKLYDLREKYDSLSFEQIEGLQIVSPIDDSLYLGELRRMMKTKLPRRVVECTAKESDSLLARGPVFEFSTDSLDKEDVNKSRQP